MPNAAFLDARTRILRRITETKAVLTSGLPHWANPETGEWTTTPDGDWTGGAYAGQLWLAHKIDPDNFPVDDALSALALMRPRLPQRSAFKGFGFYFGAAIGTALFDNEEARQRALEASDVLVSMFDEKLGLIPLGDQAEEAAAVGTAESSIDSLQAYALLAWAADETGVARYEEVATQHLSRVLDIHVREDGSVIQSSTLDPSSGSVIRTHTHKGYNDSSVWGRAQGWAMLYASHAAMIRPDEPRWREMAQKTTDWWIANAPADHVAFWDFDDPAIPNTSRDTAATAMFTAAALRLANAMGTDGAKYRSAAETTLSAMLREFLAPTSVTDARPTGMLAGGCFTRRPDARPQDRGPDNVELIFGSYFAFESLAVLTGALDFAEI